MNRNKDAAAIALMKAHYKRIERQLRKLKHPRVGKGDREKAKVENG